MGQDGAQRAINAQVARQRPGVDLGDRGHLPALQVFVQGALARVVAGDRTGPAHDQGPSPRPGRFRVGIAHAVVALQRVGHAHHLARIRRVGEHLLVAGHRGVEDDLSLTDDLGAQGIADKSPAILEHEGGRHFRSARHAPGVSSRQRSPPGRCRRLRPRVPRFARHQRSGRSCRRSQGGSAARDGRGR